MHNEDEIVNNALIRSREFPDQPSLLRKLNKTHSHVYMERGKRLQEQLNKTTLTIALEQRQSEANRGISFTNWSFEEAINDATAVSALVRAEQARMAGGSKKTDALQELIQTIVRASQKITVSGLLKKLRKAEGKGTIEGVDTLENPKPQIYFKNHNGHGNQAPISGLKDRLTRARRVINKELAETR